MQFSLSKSGTITECREALNEAIANLPAPHREANTVVRSAAHYIVDENIDPLHNRWQQDCEEARQATARGKKTPEPAEPTTSFSISLSVTVAELKAAE